MREHNNQLNGREEDDLLRLNAFMDELHTLANKHKVVGCFIAMSENGCGCTSWHIEQPYVVLGTDGETPELRLCPPKTNDPHHTAQLFTTTMLITAAMKRMLAHEVANVEQLQEQIEEVIDFTGREFPGVVGNMVSHDEFQKIRSKREN